MANLLAVLLGGILTIAGGFAASIYSQCQRRKALRAAFRLYSGVEHPRQQRFLFMAWDHFPVAVCDTCGHPLRSEDIHLINDPCIRCRTDKRGYRSRKPRGQYQTTTNAHDWAKCKTCDETGRTKGGGECPICFGSGWRFKKESDLE